ncbi:hypothetical protein [Kitasatospora griseola]|uniref:hypothetical protein n=1 Tax=Kitasatospora griseola TaxID=2064 RepID=UPI00341B8C9F
MSTDHHVDAEALVEQSVETIVSTVAPEPCLALIAELERRDLLWDGMLLLLGPTASRPVLGLGEQEAVKRLAALAETPDRVTGLTYSLQRTFRSEGAAAARTVWDGADIELQRGTAAQVLVGYCRTIGGEAGRLSGRDTVRLIRAVVPVTW